MIEKLPNLFHMNTLGWKYISYLQVLSALFLVRSVSCQEDKCAHDRHTEAQTFSLMPSRTHFFPLPESPLISGGSYRLPGSVVQWNNMYFFKRTSFDAWSHWPLFWLDIFGFYGWWGFVNRAYTFTYHVWKLISPNFFSLLNEA